METNLMPALRFSEFSGEWKTKKLGEISAWMSGGTPTKDKPEYWNGEIPWISASSMRGHIFFTAENKVSELGLKNGSRLAPKDSILILVRGSMLFNCVPVGIAGRDLAFNQDVKSIILQSICNNKFALNWLLHKEPILLSMVTGTGIGAGKLDTDELKNLPISLPTLPEQEKIAAFFTAVDEKITQLKRKKELLDQYKKGVLQKIFNREIRFSDENGQPFAEWEEKKLGEIAEKKSSNIALNSITDNFGIYPIYGAIGEIKKIDFYQEKEEYVGLLKDGAGAGRLILCAPKSSVLGTMQIIKPKKGLSTKFLYYVLNCIDFSKYITGSTIPHIYFKDYAEESISLPSLPEQEKIAAFLTALDEKIQNVQGQLERAEMWKKGLLQKMFV